MAELVCADQSGSQDTFLPVCPRPGFVLPAAASSPRTQNGGGIDKTAEPLLLMGWRKALFAGGIPQKKKKWGINIILPKMSLSI